MIVERPQWYPYGWLQDFIITVGMKLAMLRGLMQKFFDFAAQ